MSMTNAVALLPGVTTRIWLPTAFPMSCFVTLAGGVNPWSALFGQIVGEPLSQLDDATAQMRANFLAELSGGGT